MTRSVLRTSILSTVCSAAGFIASSGSASAQQAPPFFGGGAVGYDPEISIVNSGALTDVQAVVSPDRRYVTINARVSLSHLNSLQAFDVVRAQQANSGGSGGTGGTGGGVSMGYVGGEGFIDDDELSDQPAGGRRAAPVSPSRSHVNTSPTAILQTTPIAADSLLRREGMFLLAPPQMH